MTDVTGNLAGSTGASTPVAVPYDATAKQKAQAIVRGLRAVSDFEFEFQLALMNRNLDEKIETIFMMPKDTYTFISSRIVKEIARLGGNVSPFVSAHVEKALQRKFQKRKI